MFERVWNTRNQAITLFSVAAILVLANIGDYGLFDPWEMNRTHIARRMASPPSILVIGKGGDNSLAGRLRESLGGDFTVEVASLQAAREQLNGKVYDSVVLEVGEFKAAQQSETKELASFLLSTLPKNRSTQFILFAERGGVQPGELLESVRQAAISSFPEKLKEKGSGEDQDEPVIDVEKEVSAALNNLEEPVVNYEDLESLLRGRSLPHIFKAGFKSHGETLHIPVLEPLLTAIFFKVFGFSEFSARFPQAFFGLLLLLITFYFTRRIFGGEIGNLSTFIFLTTPFFLTFSKIAAGGAAFMAALSLSAFSFILIMKSERAVKKDLAFTLCGALFGYLSAGLTGVLIITLLPLVYMLSLMDFRRHIVAAVLALAALFLILVMLTLLPDSFTFFEQFKFMTKTFAGGMPADQKGFEFFIRQIGFGFFPWITIAPFAIAVLNSAQVSDPERRVNLFITIWALLPFAVLTAMLFHFNHYVYPSAPALALLCALFIRREDQFNLHGRAVAFIGLLVFVMIAKDLFTSPEPLYSLFAFDPPFSRSSGDLRFPDAVKFHAAVKIALLVFILMFAYYNSRVSSFIKTLPSRLREKRSFIIGLLVIAAVYLADVAISLALKWEYLFLRRGGEVIEQLRPGAILMRTFLTAPDIIIIYLVATLFVLNKLAAPGSSLGTRLRTEKICGLLKMSRIPDFLERYPVFLASLCLTALLFAAYKSFVLDAQTSFHFSQKHILETYKKEKGSQEGNLYKHLFSSRGTDDVNFYTALIPEVNSRDEVVRKLLLGERSFFIVPKNSFSDVNHSFRQKSGGRHIPVLDARSSRFILISNDLGGQAEQNWLKEATTTKEAAEGLKGFKKSFVNFEDKIHLLGYILDSNRVRRGGEAVIKFFFESQGGIGTSYRLFMHIDHQKGGNRIHGDHWPVNLIKEGEKENNCVGCYATTHWLKGDVVIDKFTIEIPIGSPSGTYDIWIGFYNPSDEKRLKVKDFDKTAVRHDGQNRARVGVLIVD